MRKKINSPGSPVDDMGAGIAGGFLKLFGIILAVAILAFAILKVTNVI